VLDGTLLGKDVIAGLWNVCGHVAIQSYEQWAELLAILD